MAMCKIISHLGEGEYSVEVLYDLDAVQTRIDELTQLILDINTMIIAEYFLVQEGEAILNSFIVASNSQINYINSLPINSQAWHSAIADLQKNTNEGLEARNIYLYVKARYQELLTEKSALAVEKNKLNRRNLSNPIMNVWCVDLADGLGSHGIYAADEEVELWCFSYDAGNDQYGQYVLPPRNLVIDTQMPYGHYSSSETRTDLTSACMTFWNVAIEPGFTKWQPIILKGKYNLDVTNKNVGLCNVKGTKTYTVTVTIPDGKSRLGYEMVIGKAGVNVLYYDGIASFDDQDEVVVLVSPDDISDTGTLLGGNMVGFVSHPKMPLANPSGEPAETPFKWQLLGNEEDLGTSTISDDMPEDMIIPPLIVESDGGGRFGDTTGETPTGKFGVETTIAKGFDISGVRVNAVLVSISSEQIDLNWYSKRSDMVRRTTYGPHSESPDLAVVTKVEFDSYTEEYGVQMVNGYWLTTKNVINPWESKMLVGEQIYRMEQKASGEIIHEEVSRTYVYKLSAPKEQTQDPPVTGTLEYRYDFISTDGDTCARLSDQEGINPLNTGNNPLTWNLYNTLVAAEERFIYPSINDYVPWNP